MPRAQIPTIVRLMRRVTISESGCWEFDAKKANIYGHRVLRVGLKRDGNVKSAMAHRVSWEEHVGAIPVNLCVLHKCDNPVCVNPDHLFLGTRTDNSLDKIAKGCMPKGEKLPQAKLSDAEVVEVRSINGYSQAHISRLYGVTQSTICVIRNRRSRI